MTGENKAESGWDIKEEEMVPCFFEFRVDNQNNFEKMRAFVLEVISEMDRWNSDLNWQWDPNDPKWPTFFDEDMLAKFWWPTEQEWEDYKRLKETIPEDQHWNDPRLKRPWRFKPWLFMLFNGEYILKPPRMVDEHIGRFEYLTWSFPYGDEDALRFVVKVFGFEIIREEV